MKTIELLFKFCRGNNSTNNSFFLLKKKANISWAIVSTHPMPFLSFIGENVNKL